jgi:succinate dehydrogenase/fumarate reductase-like Fe-S protein
MKVNNIIINKDKIFFICNKHVYKYDREEDSELTVPPFEDYKIIRDVVYTTFSINKLKWVKSCFNPVEKIKNIVPYLKDII